MSNHLLSMVFRFHETILSFGEPGSLGAKGKLGGGFKHFLFLPLLGEMIQLLNQMQVNSKTFANIFGGFIDLVTNDTALPVITGETWYNDLSRAAVGIARNFLREHTSAMWFLAYSYHGQRLNTDELGMDLPPLCALDNATPSVSMMLASVREYCSRLHSQFD